MDFFSAQIAGLARHVEQISILAAIPNLGRRNMVEEGMRTREAIMAEVVRRGGEAFPRDIHKDLGISKECCRAHMVKLVNDGRLTKKYGTNEPYRIANRNKEAIK